MTSKAIDTEYWKRLDALLSQALSLPPGERGAWLEGLPPEDHPYRERLGDMLARAGGETDAFMKRPVDAGTLEHAAETLVADKPGDVVGPFRLVAPLGFGGMGAVWRAEPLEGSVQRAVALKLPRTGWTPGLASRLKRECDILSKLEHPGIARLYDAGVTAAGRPWLAMQVIDGVPIDQYCADRKLTLQARLRLFLDVARAISYAHARLVVHRDLKPSNILVDGSGQVHVVDFGLAKVLDDATDAPQLTQTLARALTPDYASPEQIRGEAMTVATDVYSLGVVLYQLLAGKRPYRLKRESAAALEEAIVEADVPPASSQVAERTLARALRGDLDTILAKALRKDVNERYPTVEAFAIDVDRHLRGLPVHARPPSLGYTAGRFIRRHRGLVASTAIVVLALVAGLAGTLYQAREAAAERDRALRELRFAEASEEFMRFLLSEQSVKPLPAPELLRRAERAIAGQFADDAALRARMLLLLADLYGELSDFRRAEAVLIDAKRAATSANDRWLAAQADCITAGVYGATGRSAESLALFAAVMPRVEADPKRDPVTAQACYSQRSVGLRNLGRADEAARDAQAALDSIDRTHSGYRVNRIFLRTNVADSLTNSGRHKEAVALYEESLGELRRIGRGGTSAGLLLANNLVVILTRAGQPRRAAQVYDGLPSQEDMDRPSFTSLSINYARVLSDLGRPDEAQAMLEQAALEKERLGDKRGHAFAILAGAQVACVRKDAARCEALRADAQARMSPMLPPAHSTFASLQYLAGQVAMLRGEPARARELLESAVAHYRGAPDRNLLVVRALGHLALLRHQSGDAAGAMAAADEAIEAARKAAMGFEHTEWLGGALLVKWAIDGREETLQEARRHLAGSLGEEAARARIEGVRKPPGIA